MTTLEVSIFPGKLKYFINGFVVPARRMENDPSRIRLPAITRPCFIKLIRSACIGHRHKPPGTRYQKTQTGDHRQLRAPSTSKQQEKSERLKG
ncbi:hypothetical protein N7489_007022 [Penicillium chrysogenum]|uniref:Uncharacterized protein n=1 Tax=Penicillium chrysogenum TaxID=5076 RepID=A0ABQ8W6Q1_PENCH|nr:uncharacterized protein N7489_007022 [Penicillium chrysogenum]KAJ5236931.1 hypothetical protein N7489_007022 [Penicillium chrysogenum]KAJ5255871.1 hypothetical protein N7505_011022 [Penicillium chrysogenum]KAJ5276893.1 hypothetical protein N7524_003046 [Penicillium chrysogenum]KAJ6152364.1 hypothetical protein N7497_006683 [Penicillium chrysogenum]